MEGEAEKGCGCAVTKIYDPNDMTAPPKSYAFDRSWWSCDGSMEDPDRPGFRIPDGPNSKYVDQDMVWNDIGKLVMKNALRGYNCTVFAYGQSGCGKSYSVVGDPPNVGIIPRTVTAVFEVVDGNTDPDVRYNVEIAMLEVYMDEVYDLLEPRKKDRQKLNVFNNKGEVFIYDPKDRKNMDKIWRACSNHDKAESFRKMGDANRSIRATGMNPESSRGHTLFIVRFRKEVKRGGWVEEFRSKLCLVDLAGSERAHDTGLTGVGLEEGIAINQSLSALGQCLVQLCKGERVNHTDKLTRLLSESLGGNAVTVMIAALSPADINYNDTVSTLRFADNAKKMPVKVKKQLDPTAELIKQLQEENAKLQAQLTSMGSEEIEKERREWEEKLAAADQKVADSQKALEEMKANAESDVRVRLARAKTGAVDVALTVEELEAKVQELESQKGDSDSKLEELNAEIDRLQARIQEMGGPEAATDEQGELVELLKSRTTNEAHNTEISEQQKDTLAMLMEARLGEIERLQEARDAVRLEMLQVKKNGGTDVGPQEECINKLEEQLAAARADCEKMSEKAAEVGMGKIFRAAILALHRQDEDSMVSFLQDQLNILQATSAADAAEVKRLEAESVDALQKAQQAADEAKAAAEDALQEKMEHVQAIAAERDAAQSEARRLTEQMGSSKEDLMEKQEAIAAIIRSEMQSWEDKLQKADESERVLKKSFEDMGVSMQDMMAMITKGGGFGGKDICHFVNLCEDAHDDGLIYLIPEGTTKVKKYEDDDEEVCIKLDGDSIRPVHAVLESLQSTGVTIRSAADDAVLWVNGQAVEFGAGSVRLEHGARVIFGSDFVFRFVDPKGKKAKKVSAAATGGFDDKGVIDWHYAMAELSRKNGVDAEEEIRKAREKFNDEMAEKEAKLAEEQKMLEDKMELERSQYEKQIEELKKGARASDPEKLKEEQLQTQLTLQKFKSKLDMQRSRAQWVRAAFTAGKDSRFELDIRFSRQQMAELQPRLVEANRIAASLGVQYAFHFIDAIDPRARRQDANVEEKMVEDSKRLLLQVKVENSKNQKLQLWSLQKFRDRFVKMLAYANKQPAQRAADEETAIFWDDFEHALVGTAAIGVTPLLKMDMVRELVTLRDFSGNITGAVEVTMQMFMSNKPSLARISTSAGNPLEILKDKEVTGVVTFGRLTYENAASSNWSSFFVRFSWFDTDGRMDNFSPNALAEDLKYTFEFKQICSEGFLKFLESGVMAIQVRAYEKGVAAGELELVKQKLKATQDELKRLKDLMAEERAVFEEELEARVEAAKAEERARCDAETEERLAQVRATKEESAPAPEHGEEAKQPPPPPQPLQPQPAQPPAPAQPAPPKEVDKQPQPAQPRPPLQPLPPKEVKSDEPWLDVRGGSLEEVKAELVKARGQVFKILQDKEQLQHKLTRIEGRHANLPGHIDEVDPSEVRHADLEQAHQHILYLEMKVKAGEELEKKNEELEGRLRDAQMSAKQSNDQKPAVCEVM
ncbi:kif1 [Symbiodinium natans]|uniref:Kif1 protein n=1 Tax=Symbiodinium natans TaxID=878477 RepID=A0A812PYM6_9DINO|nr:kif1 [Symbiodinium natans]